MKLFRAALIVAAAALSGAGAFSPSSIQASAARGRSTSLGMSAADRRSFASSAGLAFVGAAFAGGNPERASAAGYFSEYTPKFDDLKQIYVLGVTLDRLASKCADEAQWDAALSGLREFNKDKNFYTGYARNYVSKSVKNNAEGDPRVGYIREASSTISSIQELLEGRQELTGKAAGDEAVKRVKDAQRLIGKFLSESGVEGEEKISTYVAAH